MDTEIYKDDKYINMELYEVRKIWGNKDRFTPESAKGISQALGLMFLYCSDEMRDIVQSHIDELCTRESVMLIQRGTMPSVVPNGV